MVTLTFVGDGRGRDEFVAAATRLGGIVVVGLDRFGCAVGSPLGSLRHHLVCLFDPFPAKVTIHRVESADHAGDPASSNFVGFRLQLTDVFKSAGGRGVAAIRDRVNREPIVAQPASLTTSMNAKACSMSLWTRPSDISPSRCNVPPVDLTCSIASYSTLFWKNDSSRIARVIRITSWSTIRPAPMFWWPTSLLPITPAGSPTSSPEV